MAPINGRDKCAGSNIKMRVFPPDTSTVYCKSVFNPVQFLTSRTIQAYSTLISEIFISLSLKGCNM